MSVRLFVGNLPYNTTDAELREHFSAVGPLAYVHIPTDRESGKPRGFAFVEFSDRSQAEEAIRRFNNQLFKGRPMTINEARARESAPPRPPAATYNPAPGPVDTSARSDKPGRNFGPDAAPRRSRSKTKGGQKSERGPKGPMREVVRGQFFGDDDDDSYEDDLSGENFASRADEDEDDN
jgi:cold-inducible RNA-binding protein